MVSRFLKRKRVITKGLPLAVSAARGAYTYARSRSKAANFSARSQQQSAPLTGQFDYKTDYSKRRLTRRRRRVVKRKRKWRRKVVNTVRNANVGSTHIVRRSLFNNISLESQSNAVTYGMYGLNGTTNDTDNSTADMREIFREISETDWASTDTGSAGQLHKIYSMHATMEITIRNVGAFEALLEAYYIRGSRRTRLGTNPTNFYAEGFAKAEIASDPNTGNTFDSKLAFTTVGTTPFQSPLFCQNFNIYKRQKFKIPAGGEINMVIHNPKSKVFRMDYTKSASTDRSYHGILFQHQGSPGLNLAETAFVNARSSSLLFFAVRRYRIKMFRDNLPKTALDNSGA